MVEAIAIEHEAMQHMQRACNTLNLSHRYAPRLHLYYCTSAFVLLYVAIPFEFEILILVYNSLNFGIYFQSFGTPFLKFGLMVWFVFE